MSNEIRLRRLVFGAGAAAAITSGAIVFFNPPAFSTLWAVAFATLLALAIVSALLALTITEGGASTAVDFLPHLASVILLGPTGALALTLVGQVVTDFLILRKDRYRALFNLFQFMVATGVAAVLFIAFGGEPSLDRIVFRDAFPPFIIAALGYFVVNSTAIFYAVSKMEGRPFNEVWREGAGTIIIFDVAMSSLAYLIAFLFVRWGAIGLLAAIIPMIGLRYSYGVNIELQRLNQDLLRVLIKTLEARDKYTSGHSVRVAERSRRIARELAVSARKIRVIETAALLHDIGKIDLAYGEILRQTGPLTQDQRELIRAHPDKGVEIVRSVRSIDPEILSCIRHHHEWFDGTGYPTGISGDEIPLGARIIMISDSVDAMMTDRPYRRALTLDEVRKELLRNSGAQFDPVVVDAAMRAQILDDEVDY
jgi:putative nucleotidyltransferase with HDIG domain